MAGHGTRLDEHDDDDHDHTMVPHGATTPPPPGALTPPPPGASTPPPHGAEPPDAGAENFHDDPQGAYGGEPAGGADAYMAAADGPPSEPVSLPDGPPSEPGFAPQHFAKKLPPMGDPQFCGLDRVIFEPAGHVPHANFAHVGTGHGAYERVHDFEYVGAGAGDFEKEEITVPYGWRLRRCCAGLMCILCSLVLLLLLIACVRAALSRSQPELTPETPPAVAPTLDYPPSPASASQTTTALPGHYDCDADYPDGDWEVSWSVGKRAYCCSTLQRACPGDNRMSGSSIPGGDDDDEPLPDWALGATATETSTTASTATTLKAFDCKAGFARRETGWSDKKKTYCCEAFSVCGSNISTTSSSPDMSTPAPMLQASEDGETTGRPPPGPGEPPTVPEALSPPTEAAPSPPLAPPEATPLPPQAPLPVEMHAGPGCSKTCSFNGHDGTCLSHMQWAAKRYYSADGTEACRESHDMLVQSCPVCLACSLADLGCAGSAPAAPPSQEAEPPAPAPWPAPAAPSEPFDCEAGFSNWEGGWSDAKKDWCCKNKGKPTCEVAGAAPGPAAAPGGPDLPAPFDCDTGHGGNSEEDWSYWKREWCCENAGSGCGGAA